MVVPVGADTEVPAAVVVQQGREDARGVETGTAHPVDGAVGAYEGRRLQVADQAVLTDVWVAVHRTLLSSRSPPSFCFAGSLSRVVQAE